MKTSTALAALVVGLSAATSADAQLFRREGTTSPRTVPSPTPKGTTLAGVAANAAPKSMDKDVKPSNFVIPEPTNPADLPPPTFPLPTEPIEPFLLTQEAGPFMVMAHTFKGPYAEKYAQALTMELRSKFGLPAYVFRPKDFPMRSMIRGVPPTAAPGVNRPNTGFPEMERIKDEAAVLVGNEKSLDDSEKLLKKVKHLKPAVMDQIPDWHPNLLNKGLARAIRTTNPFAPAEVLFPRKPDVMVQQINRGPHSISTCPGKYSMELATFSGFSSFSLDATGKSHPIQNKLDLMRSPLATAAKDAEAMAAALAKDPEVRQTGFVPYVYHDRNSSKVLIGAFNSPTDPAAIKLRKAMTDMSYDLVKRRTVETMIAPAPVLTDLTGMKRDL